MTYQEEKYSGKVICIDCKVEVNTETCPSLVEPKKISRSRVNIEDRGYELVNCDLPEEYLGKFVDIFNQTWIDEKGTLVVERQEIKSQGLEPMVNMVICR